MLPLPYCWAGSPVTGLRALRRARPTSELPLSAVGWLDVHPTGCMALPSNHQRSHKWRGELQFCERRVCSVVCFMEVKCTRFSFLWQRAGLWMDSRSHTDYIPCILVLSVPFSPFHLFFPQKFSFNSFDGGVSWIPDFVEWAFPSVTFTRGTLARVELLSYNTCHPRCSHHLMNQTALSISPWN